ncbi:MAG TPA: heparinase II/III family protein [Devosiaceae bacterium]|nr:heparinase II/III family protein [Devosiaceae bacterium]
MLAAWRYLARRALLGTADRLVTSPLLRWVWASPSKEEIVQLLGEFRPTDRETVLEMMAGRYLLASRLIDTHGVSPFSVEVEDRDWSDELRGFSWLRHFRDAREDSERRFARSLTLDWIGREGKFDRETWAPALCARRVLNWLRHYQLLVEGATEAQAATITRSLGVQISSLKLRGALAADPVDRLFVGIALAGVALCDDRRVTELPRRMTRLFKLLDRQLDVDNLHRSRSAKTQLHLLVELETLRQALAADHQEDESRLSPIVDGMHRAFDAISLSTGEPAYFNGTGQLPHDLVVAVQVQSPVRFRSTGLAGGYGRLMQGKAIVVADSGFVPPLDYTRELHASALAFEYSFGPELVVGNCGPAPTELVDHGLVFRQGITHSSLTINGVSAARVSDRGFLHGRVVPKGPEPTVAASEDGDSIVLTTEAYERRYGVVVERQLTLMNEGKSLVGQDRLTGGKPGRAKRPNMAIARFHLALGTAIEEEDDMLRLRLASGAVWSFLWEGAEMRIEDSVRQSSYFGFHRIKQIVLETQLGGDQEVSWIFTLDEHRRATPQVRMRRRR